MVVPEPVEPFPDPLHRALSSDSLPAQVLVHTVGEPVASGKVLVPKNEFTIPYPLERFPRSIEGQVSNTSRPLELGPRPVQPCRPSPLGALERSLHHQPPVRCHPEAEGIHANPDIGLDPNPGASPGTHLGIGILGSHGGG